MDDCDITQDRLEIEEALRRRNIPTLEVHPTGNCLWCGDPVSDSIRFCTPSCRDDWEYQQKRRAAQ